MADDLFTNADGQARCLRGAIMYFNATRAAELAGRLGFEAVWIEVEHGSADFGLIETLCVAADAGGAAPAVRVPDHQRCHVLRALEVGARLVVVPMIEHAEQARQLVEYGKFPPLGKRGYNTRSRGVGYGLEGVPAMFERANAATHLFAQIETAQGVANLDAICAVEGLSGILVGPGDLSVSLGCMGDMKNPRLIETVTDCIRRARAAGKHAGILVAPGPLLDAAIEAGCDLAFLAGDLSNLLTPWKELLERYPA